MTVKMEINDYILSIKLAIVAFVYSEVLTEPGMALNWLFHLLNKLPEFLFKPLIGCFKCVSGQMALWVFLYFNWNGYDLIAFGNHVFFISLTIIASWIVSKIWNLK